MYYKILRPDMKHNNMQYHEGLNTNCDKPICNKRSKRGLSFADEKTILAFYPCGSLIADVTLPEGERIFDCNGEYKAHQIILSNIRPLWTVETFEDLLEHGVNIHVDEDYAFRYAAMKGYIEIVRYLVEHGTDIHTKDEDALIFAIAGEHWSVIKYLIKQGANIHVKDEFALSLAVRNRNLGIVKYLVEQGADIHAKDDYIFHWAEFYEHTEIMEYLKSLS